VQFTPEQIEAARVTARQELWRRGNLTFKLHPTQRKIYDAIYASKDRRHFLLCSRRLGKSYLLVTLAFEQALQTPNSRILYLAPWSKDAADIANDLVVQITDDCPPYLKPEYRAQQKELAFKNGSVIRFKGTNGEHAQFLRGGAAHLVILDEVGLMDDFKHVLYDVVAPMTLTTQGRILIATTPPRSPGHESALIHEDWAARTLVSKFTLRDAPHIPYSEKVRILEQCGEKTARIPGILDGSLEPETTTAKREYFCDFVTDASSAVVPEFDDQARKDIVKNFEIPPYRDCYVAMDPGMVDATGVLFAYWDFRRAKLVIEDEWVERHANTVQIATALRTKEEELWNGKQPFMRISDVDKRLIADLMQLHGLAFSPANKKDSDASINLMRVMVSGREIEIHPRCVNLIRQLKNAVWNRRQSDFERSEIDAHYDLVAALKYLCRGLIKNRNPYPAWFDAQAQNTWYSPKSRKPRNNGLFNNSPVTKRLLRKK
jgi:hypothetical protein